MRRQQGAQLIQRNECDATSVALAFLRPSAALFDHERQGDQDDEENTGEYRNPLQVTVDVRVIVRQGGRSAYGAQNRHAFSSAIPPSSNPGIDVPPSPGCFALRGARRRAVSFFEFSLALFPPEELEIMAQAHQSGSIDSYPRGTACT